ncbi:hypothetical protein HNR39_002033 [Glaciimonas immobilis]|uniref:Uncharacterized protein n=1 Tax=Glaciimonas immobilis TaxID=728004 RepID=A0A840RT41_9BURK|nr:hypothetical protein [Glaciimonas immobilis]
MTVRCRLNPLFDVTLLSKSVDGENLLALVTPVTPLSRRIFRGFSSRLVCKTSL